MKNNTRLQKSLIIVFACLFAMSAYGYGGGGSATKTCDKPKFKNKTPEAKSVISPNTDFSFVASRNTKPRSIEVSVKGEKVDINVEEQKNGKYLVSGRMPAKYTDGFAKIKVKAKSKSKCAVSDGWLVKIEGG